MWWQGFCCRFTSQRLISCVCILAIFVILGVFFQLFSISNEDNSNSTLLIDNSFAGSALRLSRRRARERAADSHDEKPEYASLQKQARDDAAIRRSAAAAAALTASKASDDSSIQIRSKRKLARLKHQRLSIVSKLLSAPITTSSLEDTSGSIIISNLATIIAAQDESIKVLVSVGNESQIRTLNVRKTAPARLLALENQSPWGRAIGFGHYTQETEIVHPDVGLACGSDELNGDGKTGGFKCVYMPAPGGSAQCCCSDVRQRTIIDGLTNVPKEDVDAGCLTSLYGRHVDLEWASSIDRVWTGPFPLCRHEYTCFPSVVIAGSQKSGTTALFGYLLHHPNFQPSIRKEVHYFDRNSRKGLPWYLRNMPALPTPPLISESDSPQEWSDWRKYVGTHIVGEASPSYILGVGIAANIKRVLPHAKVIVMLRDPVHRTYSEIMMKKRRVANQRRHNSVQSMQPLVDVVHACFARGTKPLASITIQALSVISSKRFRNLQKRATLLLANASRLVVEYSTQTRNVGLLKSQMDPDIEIPKALEINTKTTVSATLENGHLYPAPDEIQATLPKKDIVREVESLTELSTAYMSAALRLLYVPLHEPMDEDRESSISPATAERDSSIAFRNYAAVFDALHRPVDALGRPRGSDKAVMILVATAWNQFIDDLIDLPLFLSPAYRLHKRHTPGIIPNSPPFMFDTNGLATSGAVASRVLTALSRFWDAYGGNVSEICVTQDVMTDPGLSPLSRIGKHVSTNLERCLIDRAGRPDPDILPDKEESHNKPFISSLLGWGGSAPKSFFSRGDDIKELKKTSTEEKNTFESLFGSISSLVDRASEASVGAPSGWIGKSFPELVNSLIRIAVKALMPAIVANSGIDLSNDEDIVEEDFTTLEDINAAIAAGVIKNDIKAIEEKEENKEKEEETSIKVDPSFSGLVETPQLTRLNSQLLRCFSDPAILNKQEPRYESIREINEIIRDEISAIKACSISDITPQDARLQLILQAKGIPESKMNVNDLHPVITKNLVQDGIASLLNDGFVLNSDSKECWKDGSTSNIAVDFVYRSIYARQIAELYASIGRKNVLVLADTDLRKKPQETMNLLCDFLSLPRIEITKEIEEKGVERAFEAAYPQFGLRTGWQLQGDYEPMNESIKSLLTSFFTPYNRALYEYLGKDLQWSRSKED
jgi:hypothetical protein